MSDLRKAAKLALEALEMVPVVNKIFNEEGYVRQKEAIEALRQALAQPEYGPMLGAQIASEDWIKALERGMVTGVKNDHRDKDIADLTKACQVLLRENRRLQEALDK